MLNEEKLNQNQDGSISNISKIYMVLFIVWLHSLVLVFLKPCCCYHLLSLILFILSLAGSLYETTSQPSSVSVKCAYILPSLYPTCENSLSLLLLLLVVILMMCFLFLHCFVDHNFEVVAFVIRWCWRWLWNCDHDIDTFVFEAEICWLWQTFQFLATIFVNYMSYMFNFFYKLFNTFWQI